MRNTTVFTWTSHDERPDLWYTVWLYDGLVGIVSVLF